MAVTRSRWSWAFRLMESGCGACSQNSAFRTCSRRPNALPRHTKACSIPVSSRKSSRHRPELGLGGGYHLHPNPPRLELSKNHPKIARGAFGQISPGNSRTVAIQQASTNKRLLVTAPSTNRRSQTTNAESAPTVHPTMLIVWP